MASGQQLEQLQETMQFSLCSMIPVELQEGCFGCACFGKAKLLAPRVFSCALLVILVSVCWVSCLWTRIREDDEQSSLVSGKRYSFSRLSTIPEIPEESKSTLSSAARAPY